MGVSVKLYSVYIVYVVCIWVLVYMGIWVYIGVIYRLGVLHGIYSHVYIYVCVWCVHYTHFHRHFCT